MSSENTQPSSPNIGSENAAQLPDSLITKLDDFRNKVWKVKFLEGLFASLFGLALAFLIVFILDRLFDTPSWLRATILLAGILVPGIGFPLLWHRWVFSQRRTEDVARLVRRRFPRLGDLLLGTVELAHEDSGAGQGRSERLVQAAIDQAAEAVDKKDLTEAVPDPRHRTWATAAAGVLALAVLAAFFVPSATRNAFVRWIAPWSDTERFTFAQVEEPPETMVVPYAEPVALDIALKDDTRWTPGRATARVEGQPTLRSEVGDDASYDFTLPPQKDDSTLRLRVGDDRESVVLQPRTRPELTALTGTLTLPDYLGYESPIEVEARGGVVRLLGGAEVSWTAQASRELASGSLSGTAASVDKEGRLVTPSQPVPAEAEEIFLEWEDILGLTPREPLNLRIEPAEDAAPSIAARPDTEEHVILDSEVIAFDISVRDDFGVRRTGLEWTLGRSQERGETGEKVTAAGGPERTDLDARATFSAKAEGIAPQTIDIRAWAEDYLPDRERSYSPAFRLTILNAADHAQWLTEQFGKWLDVARESYEREQQLYERNKEIRAMDPSDLDSPEVRRAIAQQANAEEANAARLDAINSAGKQLADQATRNPEFDPNQLNAWAEMLQTLDDIAKERMPSVAELLDDSSSAQASAGGKPQPPSPGAEPSPGSPGSPPSDSPPSDSPPSDSSPSDSPPSDSPPLPSGEPTPSGPAIVEGTPPAAGGPGEPEEGEGGDPEDGEPPKPVPLVADMEDGFLDPVEGSPPPEGPASSGRLGLPGTTLGALPTDPPPEGGEPGPPQDVGDLFDEALEEQEDLLDQFAAVADELSELLANLEASTFVKRLKAASQAQMEIAQTVNEGTLDAFGLGATDASKGARKTAAEAGERAVAESEKVWILQSDLSAYITRKPEARFTNLLSAMKDTEVVLELEEVATTVDHNLGGRAIAASEFWADTLDRWAEDLVAAAPP